MPPPPPPPAPPTASPLPSGANQAGGGLGDQLNSFDRSSQRRVETVFIDLIGTKQTISLHDNRVLDSTAHLLYGNVTDKSVDATQP